MKNIVILGDSFSYGEGCNDRLDRNTFSLSNPSDFAWPSLMQHDLPEHKIINLSRPGNSIQGMFVDIIKMLEKSEIQIDYVLLSITSYNRILVPYYNDPERITNWVFGNFEGSSRDEFEPIDYFNSKKSFIKHLINEDISLYNGLLSLVGLVNYCSNELEAKVLWSGPTNANVLNSLGLKFIKLDSLDTMFFPHMWEYDYSGINDKKFNMACAVSDGHPNNVGHSIYYEQVIKPQILAMLKGQ